MNQMGLEAVRECSVELRRYSKRILGYRVYMPDGRRYYVLNEMYYTEDLKIILDELKHLSVKYVDNGFLMLLEDGTVYTDPRYIYRYDKKEYRFSLDGKVIPFQAYKYYQESLKKRGLTK